MQDRLWILTASDDGYAWTMSVTVSSALRAVAPGRLVTLVIAQLGWSDDNKARMERVVARANASTTLLWYDASQLDLTGLQGSAHITVAAYMRIFLSTILPLEVGRVVYLDSDLLVRRDVGELADVDLRGRVFAAVHDHLIDVVSNPTTSCDDWQVRGYAADHRYCNTGVLVVDLPAWRRAAPDAELLAFSRATAGRLFCDQDAINMVLGRQWVELPPTWNAQTDLPDLPADPAVLHFCGHLKPWRLGLLHPFAAAWRRELLRNGWFSGTEAALWASRHGVRDAAFSLAVAVGRRERRR